MLLTAPLIQGSPEPMRAVCTPQREGERDICSRETSFVEGLAQCRDWTDTRDEERRWAGGSSDLSRCSLQTWKAVGWVWMVVGQVVCMGSCRPRYTGLLRGCWAEEERVPSAGLGRVQVGMGGGR